MTSRPATTSQLRSSRRELQGKIASIFAADEPQGRLRGVRRGFSPSGFPLHVVDFGPPHHPSIHTHRRWGSIGSRGVAADRDRRGGRSYGILRCQQRGYEYGCGKPYDGASSGLGKPSLMPSAPAVHMVPDDACAPSLVLSTLGSSSLCAPQGTGIMHRKSHGYLGLVLVGRTAP